MTRDEAIQAFKTIVINNDHHDYLQINSFAVFDKAVEWEDPTLGYTFQDYIEGNVWSRTWVNSGANKNDFKMEFPLLLLEIKDHSVEDFNSVCVESECYVVVIDKVECSTCPDLVLRTENSVLRFTLEMLLLNMEEFQRVGKYNWTEDSELMQIWTVPEHMAAIENMYDNISGAVLVEEVLPLMLSTNHKIYHWGESLTRLGLRAHSTNFKLSGQFPRKPNFRYDREKTVDVGITRCNQC